MITGAAGATPAAVSDDDGRDLELVRHPLTNGKSDILVSLVNSYEFVLIQECGELALEHYRLVGSGSRGVPMTVYGAPQAGAEYPRCYTAIVSKTETAREWGTFTLPAGSGRACIWVSSSREVIVATMHAIASDAAGVDRSAAVNGLYERFSTRRIILGGDFNCAPSAVMIGTADRYTALFDVANSGSRTCGENEYDYFLYWNVTPDAPPTLALRAGALSPSDHQPVCAAFTP